MNAALEVGGNALEGGVVLPHHLLDAPVAARGKECRFIDKMKKSGIIRKESSGKCPISHRQAGFYTSNREYFKDDRQLSLFDILWKGVRR